MARTSLDQITLDRSKCLLRQYIRDLDRAEYSATGWRTHILTSIYIERCFLMARRIDPKVPDTVLAELILEGYELK